MCPAEDFFKYTSRESSFSDLYSPFPFLHCFFFHFHFYHLLFSYSPLRIFCLSYFMLICYYLSLPFLSLVFHLSSFIYNFITSFLYLFSFPHQPSPPILPLPLPYLPPPPILPLPSPPHPGVVRVTCSLFGSLAHLTLLYMACFPLPCSNVYMNLRNYTQVNTLQGYIFIIAVYFVVSAALHSLKIV